MAKTREAKLKISADTRSADANLKNFGAGVKDVGKDVRTMAGSLRSVGSLGGLFSIGAAVGSTLDFSTAMLRAGRALDLGSADMAKLTSAAATLRSQIFDAGQDTSNFADVMLRSAVAVNALGGEGDKVDRLMFVLSQGLRLGERTGNDFGESVGVLVEVMRAYKRPAQDAKTISDQLGAASKKSGQSIEDLGSRLVNLAPSATQSKVPLAEVMALLASTDKSADGLIKTSLELTGKLRDGDTAATNLASKLGLAAADVAEPNAVTVFTALNRALTDLPNLTPAVAAALKSAIGEDALNAARTYADDTDRILRNLKEMQALDKGGTTPAAPTGGGGVWRKPTYQEITVKRQAADDVVPDLFPPGTTPWVAGKLLEGALLAGQLSMEQYRRISQRLGIPHLAEGGIVTRPTLSMIGEAGPEAVIPLDKLGSMRGASISIGQVVANNPARLARELSRINEFNAYYRKLGSRKG